MARRSTLVGLSAWVAWVALAGPASAALVSIEASYGAPGGGTATVTGIYDDAGFTGVGTEIFHFIEVDLVFSATGTSLLAGTSHHQTDMFGVAFQNGIAVDLVNHNNTDVDGKALQIFGTLGGAWPGSTGIYMADSGAGMDLEPWFVTNHQGGQAHSLTGFSEPQSVPEPAVLRLLVLGLFAGVARRMPQRRT